MIELLRAASTVAATLRTGITAGVFAANTTAIMPGLIGALISIGLTARPHLTSGPIGPNRRGPS